MPAGAADPNAGGVIGPLQVLPGPTALVLVFVLVGLSLALAVQLRRLRAGVRSLLRGVEGFASDEACAPVAIGGLPAELAPLGGAVNELSRRARAVSAAAAGGQQEQARLREELQSMARRLLTLQEDERHAISRELHDDIGQSITTIKLGVLTLKDSPDATYRDEVVAEIVAISDQTVAKLRDLSLLLRPPQLDLLGVEAALRGQTERLFRVGRPHMTITFAALPRRPDAGVELACFRIGQEALTNILRHARASHASLTLEPDPQGDRIVLTVRDDGCGFDSVRNPGLGLVIMRERAQQLGGTLEVESSIGQGTCVRATLPLQVPTADGPPLASAATVDCRKGVIVSAAPARRPRTEC